MCHSDLYEGSYPFNLNFLKLNVESEVDITEVVKEFEHDPVGDFDYFAFIENYKNRFEIKTKRSKQARAEYITAKYSDMIEVANSIVDEIILWMNDTNNLILVGKDFTPYFVKKLDGYKFLDKSCCKYLFKLIDAAMCDKFNMKISRDFRVMAHNIEYDYIELFIILNDMNFNNNTIAIISNRDIFEYNHTQFNKAPFYDSLDRMD